MGKILSWMKEETILAIPAIIYFVVTFNLINLTQRLMMHAEDVSAGYVTYVAATLGAIVVVKFLIIINYFPYINAFPNKPLIYNIIWKFFIYTFFVLIFRIIEEFVKLYLHLDNLDKAIQHLQIKLQFPVFWAIQMWLAMLFIVYVVAAEFTNVIGKDKIKKMLLGFR